MDPRTAKAIMQDSMIGVDEIEKLYKQRVRMPDIPFKEETLRACSSTHILVPDIGTSVLDIRRNSGRGCLFDQCWTEREPFATAVNHPTWRLFSKRVLRGSLNKGWRDQFNLVDFEREDLPKARELLFLLTAWAGLRQQPLYEGFFLRSGTYDVSGHWVCIGCLRGSIIMGSFHSDTADYNIGITTVRNPDQ